MSARILFEHSPKNIFFWTFTWREVHNDWDYNLLWNNFARRLLDIYPFACGLRVVEIHPGGHGLHYHLLVNKRISVQLVRRIASRYGIGWVWVERATWGSVSYLSKYLTKDKGRLFRVHRWGSFGSWTAVRTNNIVIDSPYMRSRNQILAGAKVTIGAEWLLRGAFARHGHTGMALCFEFLREGKTASACLLVNNHVELTKKGGLRYVHSKPIIPFAVVRDKAVTT